jgi:hypothetical protein
MQKAAGWWDFPGKSHGIRVLAGAVHGILILSNCCGLFADGPAVMIFVGNSADSGLQQMAGVKKHENL